ncbi:HAD family hydrolase [Nocardia sp. NPDC057668]|uniref:HAD family hydrolase n=1 Tax=Nocardia sp. NPDC057668 TaxID=3346202 RepID=UPI00366CE0E9
MPNSPDSPELPVSPASGIAAVVFDWRGTLVSELDARGWVREALRRRHAAASGAVVDDAAIDAVLSRIHTPELRRRLQAPDGNIGEKRHRETYFGVFADAGLDDPLARALWDVDSDPSYNIFAADAAETVAALFDSGRAVGVLSNIHFDIRPFFRDPPFDRIPERAFVLSCEAGVQKPDPAIFEEMLTRLGTRAAATLMVGDRENRDGAARRVGMPALIVEPLTDPASRQLGRVTAFVAGHGDPR